MKLKLFLSVFCAAACMAQPQATQKPNIVRPQTEPARIATAVGTQAPAHRGPEGPPPSKLQAQRKLHNPPPLSGTGAAAKESVSRFINWASGSVPEETQDVLRTIASARENKEVAEALCAEANASRLRDHSRTLVTLSILGEMRNPLGEECLTRFLHLPFPEKGTVIDGEIVEQTSLGTLQGKAVDGLAYMHSAAADEQVLWAVAKHPSRIVRSEAIDAYLWNHQDSRAARETLTQYVRPDEKIFLDRIRRSQGENAQSFNAKLEAYLKAHPEVAPPKPERSEKAPPKKQYRQGEDRQMPPPKP
jgi:hypothetical protein